MDSATDSWAAVPQDLRAKNVPLPAPWEELFGPLREGGQDGLVVVGQIGQSLDGRVATASGHSHYINGPVGLAHLHRLRALVDAVVIGIGTALADDPQLTVRRVPGPQPARVVIDPAGRLPPCLEQAFGSKLSGNPVVEVVLASSGGLVRADVRRSSGHGELDRAAMDILKLATPFEAFPDDLAARYDVLRFAYEWRFVGGQLTGSSVEVPAQ